MYMTFLRRPFRQPLGAAILAIALACTTQASARRGLGRNDLGGDRLFAALSGAWSGAGSVSLMGGGADRLVCRAVYRPIDPAHIGLDLHCQSATFTLAIDSTITRDGSRIGGNWRETGVGISGGLAGTISGQRINAVIEAMGMSAQLALSVRGSAQAITLVSQSQLRGAASLVMRRQ